MEMFSCCIHLLVGFYFKYYIVEYKYSLVKPNEFLNSHFRY